MIQTTSILSTASEKVLQQVQAIVQASLYLGPNDPEDSMVLEIYVMDKDVALVLYQDPTTESKYKVKEFYFRPKRSNKGQSYPVGQQSIKAPHRITGAMVFKTEVASEKKASDPKS